MTWEAPYFSYFEPLRIGVIDTHILTFDESAFVKISCCSVFPIGIWQIPTTTCEVVPQTHLFKIYILSTCLFLTHIPSIPE
jgi:hypothetical protein